VFDESQLKLLDDDGNGMPRKTVRTKRKASKKSNLVPV
jgi:hypothetical protein